MAVKRGRTSKKPESIEEWIKQLSAHPRPAGKFRPSIFFNRPGNMLEIYLSDEPHVAHWVDNHLTILVSREDPKKITGFFIEGLLQILR